jgi:predicted Zn finger-like uncharacterized protein
VNVTCEKCQRRYAIPDEKLRDRKVRIRCRNCQSPIEVSLPPAPPVAQAGAAANPWDEEPTRAAPALDRNAHWFAMKNGQQEGPLDLAALQEKVRQGEVTLATFLWRDGLPEWRKADQLPELLPVFAAPRSAKPVAAAAPKPVPEPAPRPSLQGLFDDEERTVVRGGDRPSRSRPAARPEAATASARAEPAGGAPAEGEEELEDEAPRGSRLKWLLLGVMVLLVAAAAAMMLTSVTPS